MGIKECLNDPETAKEWKSINVQQEEAKYLFELLDIDESGVIQFEEFLSGCLRLHGWAKSMDLLTVMQENRTQHKLFSTYMRRFDYRFDVLESQLDHLRSLCVVNSSVTSRTATYVENMSDAVADNRE